MTDTELEEGIKMLKNKWVRKKLRGMALRIQYLEGEVELLGGHLYPPWEEDIDNDTVILVDSNKGS